MRAQGYTCVLAAPTDADLFRKCTEAGFECWPVKFSKWSQLGDIWKLAKLFAKHKPLMVGTHSNVDSRVGLLAATLARVPVRIRYRHVSIPVKNTLINRFIYNQLCDAVITTGDCISDALAASLKLSREKIHTIATGIQPPVPLMEREAARAKIQASLNLGTEARFIGMLAELRYWKGHYHVIRAFDSISQKYPHHHVVFVGGKTNQEPYVSWGKGLSCSDRIHYVGYQKDFYDYFRAFDVALLASTQNEGIPQTLIHAMFSHTPVVGTRVGGIPEIVEDGVTGLLVPGGDEPALAAAIDETLSHPEAAKKRAETAFERVSRNNTVPVMGGKLEALIASILKKKARG